jgi:hypothetical protein
MDAPFQAHPFRFNQSKRFDSVAFFPLANGVAFAHLRPLPVGLQGLGIAAQAAQRWPVSPTSSCCVKQCLRLPRYLACQLEKEKS